MMPWQHSGVERASWLASNHDPARSPEAIRQLVKLGLKVKGNDCPQCARWSHLDECKVEIYFRGNRLSIGTTSLAFAENCRALQSVLKGTCAMREHPVQFQAKLGRCERIAAERGFGGRHSGKRGFVQSCMRGRQQ